MSQEDYREKIEEHRQAIHIESEQETNPSRITRSELRGNKNKKNKKNKNRKNRLLTVLAVIFILLPVSTLIYYGYFMQDDNSKKTEVDNSRIQIETNENSQSNEDTKKSRDDESKLSKKELEAKAKAEKVAAEKKAAKEKAEKAKSQQIAKETAAAKEKQQKIYNEAKAAGRLYNVKPGDTIESIAMNFYGSDTGITIIKEANGITGDSVQPGTTIAIPAQ